MKSAILVILVPLWLAPALAGAQQLAREIEPRPAPPRKESAEDAFRRSLSENIGDQSGDPRIIGGFMAACAGLVVGAIAVNRWRARPGANVRRDRSAAVVVGKPLNHPGKLLREIAKGVNIRPGEMKQLKLLAQEQSVQSPLVMLLCPSLMTNAMKKPPRKLDRATLGALLKKLARR